MSYKIKTNYRAYKYNKINNNKKNQTKRSVGLKK